MAHTSSTARVHVSVRLGQTAVDRLDTIAADEGVDRTTVLRVALAVALQSQGAEIRSRLRNRT